MREVQPSIGGDPEFFVYTRKKKEDKYKIVSADKFLPGKDNKLATTSGGIFFDGVQAEINPIHNTCRESFISNIQRCIYATYKKAIEKYPNHDIAFASLPSIKITPEDIKGADGECLRFGCSPDCNIYTEDKITYPDGKKFMTRFSGGHIHLGFSDIKYMKTMKSPEKLFSLVKAFDYLAGIMSTAIARDKSEIIRRKYYGQAGTYRIQNHGIEYRTLSSFWLNNPELASLFTGLIRDAFFIVYNGKEEELLFEKEDESYIRKIINTGDYEKAIEVYKNTLIPMYDNLPFTYGFPMKVRYVREFIDELVKDGYTRIFDQYKMLHYWGIKEPILTEFRGTYGVEKFSKDFEHKFFTAKEIKDIGDE